MTTKKPDKPIKPLEEMNYEQLLEALAKQEKLINDGVTSKLPDKGEKIRKSIEYIKKLISDYYIKHPVGDLEKHFNSLTIKQDVAMSEVSSPVNTKDIPMESTTTTTTITITTNTNTKPNRNNNNNNNINSNNNGNEKEENKKPATNKEEIKHLVVTGASPEDSLTIEISPLARPIIQKLFEKTENKAISKRQKDHLDLLVRGRRGVKFDEKHGYKGAVAIGLEESIRLRDAWRYQKHGAGDDDERTIKYEVTIKGGEEQEDDEMRDEGLTMEEMEGEEGKEGMEGRVIKKKEGEGEGRKPSAGKKKQQQPVWDVEEDIKDILDLIPAEYKQPQKR